MKHLMLGLLFFVGVGASAQNIISMIGSNAVDKELPVGVFDGKGFRANPVAKYVKLHLYPDKPIKNVGRIEIVGCDYWKGSDNTPRNAFVNFDELTGDPMDEEDKYLVIRTTEPNTLRITQTPFNGDDSKPRAIMDIESLTINFGPVDNVCIKSVQFFDITGKPIGIQGPKVVEGTVTASSIQLPKEAYSPENLFDSKFENAWATNKVLSGSTLDFKFAQDTKIEKIKIWNGYQRSVTHCQQNSRVKTLNLSGDGGYNVDIQVADKLGGQEIALTKPFNGKKLKITVKDGVKGKSYEDLAITEMRFSNGKDWFLVNPLPHIQEVSKKYHEQFKKAQLNEMLDQEFASNAGSEGEGYWTFRLRSDGSLYINGNVPGEEEGTSYSALGNYEIKSVTATEIQLRTFGFLYKGKYGMDCNGCGVACNSPNKQDGTSQNIFQQNIKLKMTKDNTGILNVEATNDSKPVKLKFKKLILQKKDW